MSSPPPACETGRAALLLVECDSQLADPLIAQLAADGYAVRLARSCQHVRLLARDSPPELLILGGLEPPHAALELLGEIRARGRTQSRSGRGHAPAGAWIADLPVIVLSEASHEVDLLRAFEAGADDFLARPISYLELRARLRAVLARTARPRGSKLVRTGPLTIDTDLRVASLHGRSVSLRRLEYELLLTLARDPRRVFARAELMRLVWGRSTPGSTRTLDTHASRLRCALRGSGADEWILNVRGVGYRLR